MIITLFIVINIVNNNINTNQKLLLIKCYYCPLEFDKKVDYLEHAKDKHPEELWFPNIGMINIIRKKWGYDIEPKGNPWE